jgi:hypothetical protein
VNYDFSGIKQEKQEFWRRVEPKEPDQIASNGSDPDTRSSRKHEKARAETGIERTP